MSRLVLGGMTLPLIEDTGHRYNLLQSHVLILGIKKPVFLHIMLLFKTLEKYTT